jgi:hypothetical protein
MKKSIPTALAAALLVAMSHNTDGVVYKGKEYFLTSTETTWAAAEAEAIAEGGHLVSINDLEEELFIEATFVDTPSGKTPRWIGLRRVSASAFAWTSGDPVTYTQWNPGEPNNLGGEDVVIFWSGMGGAFGWNDVPAWYTGWRGIIERPFVDTEEPSLILYASPTILWPPNHKMVDVFVLAQVSDNSGERCERWMRRSRCMSQGKATIGFSVPNYFPSFAATVLRIAWRRRFRNWPEAPPEFMVPKRARSMLERVMNRVGKGAERMEVLDPGQTGGTVKIHPGERSPGVLPGPAADWIAVGPSLYTCFAGSSPTQGSGFCGGFIGSSLSRPSFVQPQPLPLRREERAALKTRFRARAKVAAPQTADFQKQWPRQSPYRGLRRHPRRWR